MRKRYVCLINIWDGRIIENFPLLAASRQSTLDFTSGEICFRHILLNLRNGRELLLIFLLLIKTGYLNLDLQNKSDTFE